MDENDSHPIFHIVNIVENIISWLPPVDKIRVTRVSTVFASASRSVLRQTKILIVTNRPERLNRSFCPGHPVSYSHVLKWPTREDIVEDHNSRNQYCFQQMKKVMMMMPRLEVLEVSVYGENDYCGKNTIQMMIESQMETLRCLRMKIDKRFMSETDVSVINCIPNLQHLYTFGDGCINIGINPALVVFEGKLTDDRLLKSLPQGFKRLKTLIMYLDDLRNVQVSQARDTIESLGCLWFTMTPVIDQQEMNRYRFPQLKQLDVYIHDDVLSGNGETCMQRLFEILSSWTSNQLHLSFRVSDGAMKQIKGCSWVRLFNSVEKLILRNHPDDVLSVVSGEESLKHLHFPDFPAEYNAQVLVQYLEAAFQMSLKSFILDCPEGTYTSINKDLIQKLENLAHKFHLEFVVCPRVGGIEREDRIDFVRMQIKKLID